MEIKGRKFLVLGGAKSGIAAAKFLVKKGGEVLLSDTKNAVEMEDIEKEATSFGIKTLWGQQPQIDEIKPDVVLVSPGIPINIPPIQEADKKNIPIIGELELAYGYSQAPFIAVTGTNGKTTTTALIGQIFKDADRTIVVGGNIGIPLISEVEKLDPTGLVIAEVSSFQLETTNNFKPRFAVILNITPDHLDRHHSMENYRQIKARIFLKQREEDFLVLNYDDPLVKELALKSKGQVIFFSSRNKLEEGVYLLNDEVVINIGEGPIPICRPEEIYIKGRHNLENAMAAIAVGYMMGLNPAQLKETLVTFKGVPHRLEFVAEVGGIKFINDSKGTNPDASIKALESYSEPIILIAGGKNKGSDFQEFAQKIKEHVKDLVLVGQAAPEIKQAVIDVGFDKYHEAASFSEAIHRAYKLAKPGEVVLLSPGCASWDMFANFEQRGDIFKELVYGLRG